MARPNRRSTLGLARALGADAELVEAILADPHRFYRTAYILKKDGSSKRSLRVPADELKRIQRSILHRLLNGIDGHPANYCRRGRSVVKNANKHLGKKWVAAFDISHCFPSVTPAMVGRSMKKFGMRADWLPSVVSMTTLGGELRQGAPTSPAILSGVLRSVDEALTKEAVRQGLTYTRYVDDLFVSGGRRFPSYEHFLRTVISSAGLTLGEGKTRHWGPHNRATLAGIVVSTTMSPTTEFMRSVTSVIAGLEDGSYSLTPTELRRLEGKIAWIKAVSPPTGRRMERRMAAALE